MIDHVLAELPKVGRSVFARLEVLIFDDDTVEGGAAKTGGEIEMGECV